MCTTGSGKTLVNEILLNHFRYLEGGPFYVYVLILNGS